MTYTTMKVERKTLQRLANHGKKAETYDMIVNKMIDAYEKSKQMVNTRKEFGIQEIIVKK